MLAKLRNGGLLPVVGVDAEWVAKRPVSLLQLATHDACLLLRLHSLFECDQPPPPSLVELLSDPGIVKTGVGVMNDLRLVGERIGVESSGVLELQDLASREVGFPSLHDRRYLVCIALLQSQSIYCGDDDIVSGLWARWAAAAC